MNGPDAAPTRLGALEQQVMDVLWDADALTIRDIIDSLDQDLAYTTIATVLTNLAGKGLVASERRGRSAFHRARVSREEHAAGLMRHALAAGGDHAVSILHFVDSLSREDAAMLRSYLDRRGEG